MRDKIILIGGGGHCASVIDVIEAHGGFEILGIVDSREKAGGSLLGYNFIGTDEDVPRLLENCKNVHISIGFIKDPTRRVRLYQETKELKANFPVICSPNSHVSKHAVVGEGTIVMHGALINAGAKIGVNAIINSKALVEHDTVIGDHCHVATGAIINGNCRVDKACFVGSNSVLVQGCQVASGTIIGAGTLINRDVTTSGKTLVGNPFRIL